MSEINLNKYSRQVLFWPQGEKNQHNLQEKTVSIIGAGALGTVLANHLVRAGTGEVRLIDRDFVEESNLQRQMLFDEQDVRDKLPKAIAAADKLTRINSEVAVVPFIDDANASNIEELTAGSHIILDGTDNMETRYLINDVSVKNNIPWIYAGVVHSRAMTTTVIPGETPCFRCLFPVFEAGHGETCDTVGVLSTAVHIIASYQATEALKLLAEESDYVRSEMIQLDVWKNDYSTFPFQYSQNPDCPCCQKKTFEYLNQKISDKLISSLCGRNAVQITPNYTSVADLSAFEKKWSRLGKVQRTPYLLRLNYNDKEISLFKTGRVLINGTDDADTAKRLYSILIGN
ncbi:ThiF family adenylyltransferase [Evansella clarkii]|uniref:ThiF family adenylyltransferase n=1 Tax=Evansella clarkii TaxID=79879 RepID=UPI000B4356F9|nr:ThiF family adenylyltransferase [Evansella clarkii]